MLGLDRDGGLCETGGLWESVEGEGVKINEFYIHNTSLTTIHFTNCVAFECIRTIPSPTLF